MLFDDLMLDDFALSIVICVSYLSNTNGFA